MWASNLRVCGSTIAGDWERERDIARMDGCKCSEWHWRRCGDGKKQPFGKQKAQEKSVSKPSTARCSSVSFDIFPHFCVPCGSKIGHVISSETTLLSKRVCNRFWHFYFLHVRVLKTGTKQLNASVFNYLVRSPPCAHAHTLACIAQTRSLFKASATCSFRVIGGVGTAP